MQPTAKSLVLDLLTTIRRGSVSVRSLIRAADLFGIADNSIRVALARLVGDGLVLRDARGQYRLARGSFSEHVRSWRRQPDRVREWAGGWVAVHSAAVPRADTRQVRRRERALRHLGFRTLRPGFEIRPDNLVGGVAAVRDELFDLGVEASALVVEVGGLSDADTDAAMSLWDGEALARGYRETLEALAASAGRLGGLPRAQAMIESFRIGGAAIARVLLDPLLPAPIADPDALCQVVERMREYDLLGRETWSGWMDVDSDELTHSPADLHAWVAEAPGRSTQRDTLENPR